VTISKDQHSGIERLGLGRRLWSGRRSLGALGAWRPWIIIAIGMSGAGILIRSDVGTLAGTAAVENRGTALVVGIIIGVSFVFGRRSIYAIGNRHGIIERHNRILVIVVSTLTVAGVALAVSTMIRERYGAGSSGAKRRGITLWAN
jgi:hypothetical protein